MATFTLRKLTELIRRDLSGGFPSDMDRVKDAEIQMHINSVAGALLRKESFEVNFGIDGGYIPEGCILATFTVDVTRSVAGYCAAKLPIVPMMLPNRIGVFSVYPSGQPDKEYIPLPPNVINQVRRDKLLNPINRKCYSWDGNKITVFDDIFGTGITKLDVKLCTMDIASLDLDDPLPLPPELISEIAVAVANIYRQPDNKQRTESNQPQP